MTCPPVYERYTNTLHTGIVCAFNVRGTRERSPPLPKIVHPSLPRLRRSQASTRQSARPESPPEGTACLITVSPVPGKLTHTQPQLCLYTHSVAEILVGFDLISTQNIHSCLSSIHSLLCRSKCYSQAF